MDKKKPQKTPSTPKHASSKQVLSLFILLILTWTTIAVEFFIDHNTQDDKQIVTLQKKINILEEVIYDISRKIETSSLSKPKTEEPKNKLDTTQPPQETDHPTIIHNNLAQTNSIKALKTFEVTNFDPQLPSNLPPTPSPTEIQNNHNLVISAVKLRDAVKSSRSYAGELSMLKIFSHNNDEITQNITKLENFSQTGIPTFAELKQEFNEVSEQIIHLSRTQNTNQTFVDQAILKLSGLIKIRKIEPSGQRQTTEDILARAYKHMLTANLSAVISEINKLPTKQKQPANSWIEKVQSTIQAQQATDEIFQQLTKTN